MKWETAKLEDIATIIDGDRGKNYPKQQEFFDKGYCLFLNTGNVTKDGFRFESNQFISEEKDSKLRKGKLQRGDIVYTTRGTVGNVGYYSERIPFNNIRINSGMVILRVRPDVADVKFIYQLLKSTYQKNRIKSYITGSAQPQLPIKNLSKILIQLPPIETQRRIADILTAYDDLIENNQKQIKLLEEAAIRLYKEWFVKLRFPGYEATKIVDGIPEGWDRGSFEDLCTQIKDAVKPKDIVANTPYIGLEHIPRKSICLNEWVSADGVNSNKFKFTQDDILFGKIRPYFHKVGFALVDGVTSTDSMVFRAKENMFGLLLMIASSDSFVQYSYITCKEGSKMPRADWNEMKRYQILIPDNKILIDFNRRIYEYTRLMKVLSLQIRSLRQARDKLLPRLMSGEIEV